MKRDRSAKQGTYPNPSAQEVAAAWAGIRRLADLLDAGGVTPDVKHIADGLLHGRDAQGHHVPGPLQHRFTALVRLGLLNEETHALRETLGLLGTIAGVVKAVPADAAARLRKLADLAAPAAAPAAPPGQPVGPAFTPTMQDLDILAALAKRTERVAAPWLGVPGVGQRTVKTRLPRLEKAGLVDRAEGRNRGWAITQAGRDLRVQTRTIRAPNAHRSPSAPAHTLAHGTAPFIPLHHGATAGRRDGLATRRS